MSGQGPGARPHGGGSDRLDWAGMMRAGLTRLRLHPRDFWALTPAELHIMLGLEPGQAPMGRAALEALAAAYPDHKEGQDDG